MAKLANSMPHVAILLESTYATHTQILRGILRFTQLHTPWTLDVRMGRAGEPTSFDAEKWNVDAEDNRHLQEWLLALPRPTALFAAYDICARQVLDACRAAGLAVPDDIAKTTRTQADIAAACGFCDASHLNVIFRRHCGVLPSAFRN